MAIKTFTAGSVLTASDTNTYLANAGLVYVTSVAVGSGVTSVNVPNAFSATYDAYKVIWTGGTISSLALIYCYMGAASGTAYYGARTSANVSGSFVGGGDNNTAYWQFMTAGNTNTAFMEFDLFNPYLATVTSVRSIYSEPNGASSAYGMYGGYLNNTTSYTSFTIDPQGTTTMTGGTITVYGYRKA